MKNTERTIYIYDVKVDKRAAHALVPSLTEIAAVWQAAFNAGTASHKREKGTVVYRIGDMSINDQEGIATLLLRRSDRATPDAAYSHMGTGDLRIAGKEDEEGGDTAAHIVLSLRPEQNTPHTYLAFVEGIPRIGHHYVQSVLNGIIRSACSADKSTFTYPHPTGARLRDGSPRRDSFVPTIELRGHMADDFIADLENGTISNIQLVKQENRTPLAGNEYLAEQTSTLKVAVDKHLPRPDRWNALVRAMTSRKENFQTGRIVFQDPSQKTHTIEIDLDTGTPEQQTYVKSFVVGPIEPPLAQSTSILLPCLIGPMVEKLIADRQV
jgi:hypothetical protein